MSYNVKSSKSIQGQATLTGWPGISAPKFVPANFDSSTGGAHAPGGRGDGDEDDGPDWDGQSVHAGDPKPGVPASGDGSVSGDSDAAKVVELCDDIIQQYARGERDKLDSVALLCDTLDEAGANDAFDGWLDKLQRAGASKRRAARAGAGDAASPLRGSARRAPVEERRHRQPEHDDAATPAAARSARFAPPDDGDDSDSSDSSAPSGGSGRATGGSQHQREAFDILKTPFGRPNIATRPISAHVLKTIELRVNYCLDLKLAKSYIASDPNAPPFPQDQWETVLRDGVIDFNKLLSARFPSEVQDLATHHIGGTDGPAIVFGSRAKRTVQSRTDWVECWEMYELFVAYLFPHRAHELRSYRTHIVGLFSSRAADYHAAVIQADIAMRSEVALRNDLALDDFQQLIFVWQRFVDARGSNAADASASTPAASSSHKTKPRRGESSREFCNNWNKGKCTYKNCRHVHACNICGARGHRAPEHPSNPAGSSSSTPSTGGTVDAASGSSRRA